MKWQWFKFMLDRPYGPCSEMVLHMCIAGHKDNSSSFQNCWQESYIEEMFPSSIPQKSFKSGASVLACLMLEQDVLGKHASYKEVDIINIFQLYMQLSSEIISENHHKPINSKIQDCKGSLG